MLGVQNGNLSTKATAQRRLALIIYFDLKDLINRKMPTHFRMISKHTTLFTHTSVL